MNEWLLSLPNVWAYFLITAFSMFIYLTLFAQPLVWYRQLIVLLILVVGSSLIWFLHILKFPVLAVLTITFTIIVLFWLRKILFQVRKK